MTNRYVCSALEELRTALSLMANRFEIPERAQAHPLSLLEEIQTYVNRMESSLGDKWDMKRMQEERCALSKKRRALRAEVKDLEAQIADMTGEEEEADDE